MIGIYFSGTGNTKHCVTKFIECFGENIAIPIETPNIDELIIKHDTIVFGYPVYFSNIPKIVRDFIINNSACFYNKKIFVIATMGLWSGDGTGCSARVFEKYGGTVIGGLHLKMPDCIGDEKVLKKTTVEKKALISQTDSKICSSAEKLKATKPTQDGLSFPCQMAGLFGQRLWFYKKTTSYKKKTNINMEKCIGYGQCVPLCPMENIELIDNKAVSMGKCTLCYRCFSHCPTKALTILGKTVYEQYLFENFK